MARPAVEVVVVAAIAGVGGSFGAWAWWRFRRLIGRDAQEVVDLLRQILDEVRQLRR